MQSLFLILRFRDLAVSTPGYTIDQHNELVFAHGYTWWGWWKKQSEHVPVQLWDDILSEINQIGGPVTIYLLDTGQRKLYKGKLNGIEFEPGQRHLSPPEEGNRTPTYYQQPGMTASFYSWFKLSDIEEINSQELHTLSFERVPHDDVVLVAEDQLVGKRIFEIETLLYFGNVTYWVAKTAQPEDIKLEGLFTRTPKPIAPDYVVTAKTRYILHLSDLHFGPNHAFEIDNPDAANPSLAQAIMHALPEHNRPGIVVVTGDLTWSGSQDEFEHAYKSLDDLRSSLGLSTNHFLIIPGNHDVGWIPADSSGPPDSPLYRMANTEAKTAYQTFFRDWYKTNARPDFSVARRFFVAGGPTLDILGLNSAALQQAQGIFAGIGRIPEIAYGEAVKDMGWNEVPRATTYRIILCHHHLLPVVDVERPGDAPMGFGIAMDAGSQLRRARDLEVNLVVHGHQHQPFAGAVSVADFYGGNPQSNNPILILGGGSAGVTDDFLGPIRQRAFHLLEITSDGLSVELFTTSNEPRTFSRTSCIEAPHGSVWKQRE